MRASSGRKVSAASIFNLMDNLKFLAILSQITVSLLAYERILWKLAGLIKKVFLPAQYDGLFPWAYQFYHPYQGALLNYILLSLGMAVAGVLAYSLFPGVERFKAYIGKTDAHRVYLFLVLSFLLLAAALLKPSVFVLFPLLLFPFLYGTDFLFLKKVSPIAAVVVLGVLCFEPLRVMVGPVRLMNEYAELYGTTFMAAGPADNKAFLAAVSAMDTRELTAAYQFQRKMEQPDLKPGEYSPESVWNMPREEVFPFSNLIAQGRRKAPARAAALRLKDQGAAPAAGQSPAFNEIRDFYRKNRLEYSHQNAARGQINHIGHILNPINEYISGKPLKSVFMQYGLGNTFLLKWTMDLFGGISIQNYYKCYAYYIIYFLLFLGMLRYIFDDPVYVFASLCGLAAAHFFYSYTAFILAPGIIPTIHFFDIFAAMALMLCLKEKKELAGTLLAFLSAFAGLMFNRQFGLVLLAALCAALALYLHENKAGRSRLLSFLFLAGIAILTFYASSLVSSMSSSGALKLYLTGFFSWAPSPLIVALTLIYFAFSYLFLAFIRQSRAALKYFYVFLFVYTQGLFVYFYWSGFINHLPMVLPFFVFQFFLTLFMLEQDTFGLSPGLKSLLRSFKALSVLTVFAAFLVALWFFYGSGMGKSGFDRNFADHKTYQWTFERAKLVSTIDPKQLEEAVSLIKKYASGENNGIYILSKMDNLLPFLSKKYSRLPFFDLSWYLVNSAKRDEVVARLQADRPDRLFVDNDISKKLRDPWGTLFTSEVAKQERNSRAGRFGALGEIFDAVSPAYRLLEKGSLISVYKRVN